MKKQYQQPSTILHKVETTILCASGGGASGSSNGSLQDIGKTNGVW